LYNGSKVVDGDVTVGVFAVYYKFRDFFFY
jgi:hypothetical protein